MKAGYLILAILWASAGAWAATEGKTGAWTEVVDSGDGRYSLHFEPEAQRVDVTKLDRGTAAPSAVKLRIHRRHEKPLELRLRTLEVPNEPIRYEGQLRNWKNSSVVGFELDLSFDKKTWKKVKRFFGSEN